VIGVPAFVSHTFTYEYHPLQSGYAALLREGLAKTPGVAVVEIEEARSIRHELELGGGREEGIWPAFVEGNFEVTSAAAAEPAVDFTIAVRTTAGVRTLDKHALTLQQAAAFVASELPREILPDARGPAPKPFTPEQEFSALTSRADSFANVGEFPHSVDLRQAALVLNPDSVEQHKKLSSEAISYVESLGSLESRRAAGEDWESITASGLTDWESGLESLEWQLHRSDDANGDKIRLVHRALIAINCFRQTKMASEAQQVKREFVLRMADFLRNPSWPGNSASVAGTLRIEWARMLIESAAHNYAEPLSNEDYELLLQLLNAELPKDLPVPRGLADLLLERVATPELTDFINRLGQSSRPRNQFLSRLATVNARVHFEHSTNDAVLQEIDALDCQCWTSQVSGGNDSNRVELRKLESLRIEVGALRDTARSQHPLSTHHAVGDASHVVIEAGALRLEELPLSIRQLNGDIAPFDKHAPGPLPGFGHILRCTDSFTVIWDQSRVMVIREPGKCEEVLALKPGDPPDFADCQWDGKHIWLATLHQGLWRLDSTGTIAAKIDASQGLPPCDRGVRLAPIGVDKLIVAGAFGPTHRAFLALVETDAGRYRVNVILKAPRVIEDQRSKSGVADADLAFIPQELPICHARDGSGRFVIVRRLGATRGANTHPLIVDCRSMNVAVATAGTGLYPILGCAGGILSASDLQDAVILSHPSADGKDLVPDFPPLKLPRAGTMNSWAGASSGGWAVAADGNVYLMGAVWFRVDPLTWTARRLKDAGSLPTSLHLGGETHFGYVAWGNDATKAANLYRVTIDEQKAVPLTIAP
jgi:hypothetical protein